MARIVISYRQYDTAAIAAHLGDYLTEHFGEGEVTVGVGDDKAGVEATVGSARVLILLMGPQWTEGDWMNDPSAPDRIALTVARSAKCEVIPVLAEGLDAEALPESMVGFAQRSGVRLNTETFEGDAVKLIKVIEKTLGPAAEPAQPAAPQAAPTPEYNPPSDGISLQDLQEHIPDEVKEAFDAFVPSFRALFQPLPAGATYPRKQLVGLGIGWGIGALLVSLYWLLVAILNFRTGDFAKLYLTIFATLGGAVVGYVTALILGHVFPALKQSVPPLNQWGLPSGQHIAPSLRQRYVQMMVGGWALAFFVGTLVVNNVGSFWGPFRTWSMLAPLLGIAATLAILYQNERTRAFVKNNWLVIAAVWLLACFIALLFFAIFDRPIDRQLWHGHEEFWSILVTFAYIIAYVFVGVSAMWFTIRAALRSQTDA
jgi:hypothetical protein